MPIILLKALAAAAVAAAVVAAAAVANTAKSLISPPPLEPVSLSRSELEGMLERKSLEPVRTAQLGAIPPSTPVRWSPRVVVLA
jgi:hypothetical protein